MSNIAFSTATALLGSAVVSWLRHAAQNVIAWRRSTPNAILSSQNSILNTLNSKANNSISRFSAGMQPNYLQGGRKSCCLSKNSNALTGRVQFDATTQTKPIDLGARTWTR